MPRLWASATLNGINLIEVAERAALRMREPAFLEASPQGVLEMCAGDDQTNIKISSFSMMIILRKSPGFHIDDETSILFDARLPVMIEAFYTLIKDLGPGQNASDERMAPENRNTVPRLLCSSKGVANMAWALAVASPPGMHQALNLGEGVDDTFSRCVHEF